MRVPLRCGQRFLIHICRIDRRFCGQKEPAFYDRLFVLTQIGGAGRAALNATMGSLGWTWVHNRPGGSAGFGTGGASGAGSMVAIGGSA